MMNESYDEFAARLTAEYSMFLFALAGAYLTRVGPGATITPQLVKDFRKDAVGLVTTFHGQAERATASFLAGIEAPNDHRRQIVLSAIAGILRDNLAQVERQMLSGNRTFLDTLKNARGALGLLVQKKVAGVDFKTKDSSGRTWDSDKLFRVIVRDFAYQSTIDGQIQEMIDEGRKLAKIVYADPTHANHDGIVSLEEEIDGYPTVASIRQVVFHPNATAELTHV